MFFQENNVARVGTEGGVCQVTQKGHETNDEIEEYVEHHLYLDTTREASIDT